MSAPFSPRLGLSLPLTGRVGSVGRLADELTAEVVLAEGAGFSLATIPEHRQGARITFFSPLTPATHVLAATRRIQVATGILVLPAHHPLHVAESVTMLYDLSGGRFALGVGAGYQTVDIEPLGRKLPARGRMLEESLEALGLLLGEDEATFALARSRRRVHRSGWALGRRSASGVRPAGATAGSRTRSAPSTRWPTWPTSTVRRPVRPPAASSPCVSPGSTRTKPRRAPTLGRPSCRCSTTTGVAEHSTTRPRLSTTGGRPVRALGAALPVATHVQSVRG